ncbi:MAG TPA: HAMP domain-containing sensor histidine kinase [Caldilineaceae bacterium]|nr:HAMP domain-containing sensor histidine kinase [Caldilineaceae bacterium]
MVSSQWRHAIEGHAVNIRDEVELLRRLSKDGSAVGQRRLDKIDRLAQQILAKGLTPPLTGQEGVESIDMDVLVRERLHQLQENENYQDIGFDFASECERPVTVRCSPEWLRHVVDLFVDNAVAAMRTVTLRQLRIKTRCVGAHLQIAFTDTGPGILPERIPLIGHQPVSKNPDEPGLGMGLLMAQMILQTYNGDITIGQTGPTGTTMCIRLPIEPGSTGRSA